MIQRIKEIRALRDAQGTQDLQDLYMMGLYNGLELALCVLEERAPQFKEKPKAGNESQTNQKERQP